MKETYFAWKLIKRIAPYVLLFYALLLFSAFISFYAFTSIPSLGEYRDTFLQATKKRVSTIMESAFPAFDIFKHNMMIALLMALPYVGVIAFLYFTATTGIALGAILSASEAGLAQHLALVSSIFLPHGILEALAYSIALHSATRKSLKSMLKLLPVIAIMLLVAALVEYGELLLLHHTG
ncbi:MAG: stage II sporulation protein M [Thermoprotei archaeon]|nr:stage II sporulation protein M [Thermoprotei archaeon]